MAMLSLFRTNPGHFGIFAYLFLLVFKHILLTIKSGRQTIFTLLFPVTGQLLLSEFEENKMGVETRIFLSLGRFCPVVIFTLTFKELYVMTKRN